MNYAACLSYRIVIDPIQKDIKNYAVCLFERNHIIENIMHYELCLSERIVIDLL